MWLAPGQAGLAVEQRDDIGCCFVTPLLIGETTETPTEGGSSSGGTASDTGLGRMEAANDQVGTAALQHSAGYHLTWFEDPIHVDVNKVKNTIDWYWNGSLSSNYTAGYYYWWLSETGWKKSASDFDHGYADKRKIAFSNSYVHYKNTIFCATSDTDVWYDRNRVRGYYNGVLWGTCEWRKAGKCSGMLHVHYELKRTLN